ncbi:ADP-ribosylglycohydrolase family protein [Candidatus Micrarchaeota archaeon]|nr:ADP-ribosylglycohydrolase family protein [Candidatus Micrarchaeota archaeon]
MVRLIERKKGALVGAAIGDALGMPTEFISQSEHIARFNGRIEEFARAPKGHPCRHLTPGQWTDDTQQMIALGKSLAEKKSVFDIEDFSRKLVEWGESQKNPKHNRWPGGTSLSSVERLKAGIKPSQSGSTTTDSCGSVMRVAPIGLAYSDPHKARKAGVESSIPTHNSDVCKSSAGAVAEIVSRLVHLKQAPLKAVKEAQRNALNTQVKDMLKHSYESRSLSPREALAKLGAGSSALETMGFAVYAFLHSPKDFKNVVVTAANAVPGDTDSVAAVAGALAGAHNGYKKIPKNYLRELEKRREIESLAQRI